MHDVPWWPTWTLGFVLPRVRRACLRLWLLGALVDVREESRVACARPSADVL